jgi:hypothetical protein
MPLYDFIDLDTGEVFEEMFKFAERDAFLKDNPQIKQIMIKPPMIVSGVGGVKNDDGFNDLMKKIASENPDTPFGQSISGTGRSAKAVKTSAAVKKWKEKAGVVGMMGGQS